MYPIKGNHVPIVETHYRINEFQHEAAQRCLVQQASQASRTNRHILQKFSWGNRLAQLIRSIGSCSASGNSPSPETVLTLQPTRSESQ